MIPAGSSFRHAVAMIRGAFGMRGATALGATALTRKLWHAKIHAEYVGFSYSLIGIFYSAFCNRLIS